MPEQEKDMEIKKTVTAERIKRLTKENRVRVKKGRKCVDSRYLRNSEESGKLARGGADGGYIQAVIALRKAGRVNLGVRECVDMVLAAIRLTGNEPTIHTDQHASKDPKNPTLGCGHLGKAADEKTAYKHEVEAEDMQEAIIYLKELAEKGEVKIVELPGEHEESAVVINDGKEWSIDPNDGELFVFVYDRKRDMDFVENELFPHLNLEDVSLEEYQEVLKTQTQATVELLAKGMPQFLINADEEDREVEELGIAV